MTILEQMWQDFRAKAFPDVPADDLMEAERGSFMAGVTASVSYQTKARDADLALGRLGELVKAIQDQSDIDVELVRKLRENAAGKVECYDGSFEL